MEVLLYTTVRVVDIEYYQWLCLTFYVCKSHVCDTDEIGHPHSNPHPLVQNTDTNIVMLGTVMPAPAEVGLRLMNIIFCAMKYLLMVYCAQSKKRINK